MYKKGDMPVAGFKKGVSGNPSGRPKDPFKVLIHEKTNGGKVLVEKVLSLLDSKDEDIQMKAVGWLADRGWGKAAQSLDIGGADGEPLKINVISYAKECQK